MDLQQFLSRPSGSFSRAFQSRHFNQNLADEVRELAHRGLKLFPVGLAAKLAGDPDRLIAAATDDILLLQELSATQPLSGYRLAIGQSGLCVWRLDEPAGKRSFASLAPDLDASFTTLRARRGDAEFLLFRRPAGMRRIAAAKKLPQGVSILGDSVGLDVPPADGAAWVNPGTEIEALPYALRQLLAPEDPDTTPGRAIPAPKLPSRPASCRPAARFPQPNQGGLRKGHPVCNQAGWRRGGYRISRQR